jgi:hypothetical protein
MLTKWLLDRLASQHLSESLAGDLVEEHGCGRSRLWVWAQVLAAISIAAWQEIRTHTFVAVSGAVTGIACLWGFAALAAVMLTNVGFPHAVHWRWPEGLLLFGVGFLYTGLSGWIVGRAHRAHRQAAVFSFLVAVLIVPVLELPLLFWFAPSVSVTIARMLPILLIATLVGAPVAILVGGFWDSKGSIP